MNAGAFLKVPERERNSYYRQLAAASQRGFALFISCFTLLGIVGEFRIRGLNSNIWWLDTRFAPPALTQFGLILAALVLLLYAFRPPQTTWRRGLTLCTVATLGAVALFNSVEFYTLLLRGTVTTRFPLALSLIIALGLFVVGITVIRTPGRRLQPHGCTRTQVIATSIMCAFLFAVLQMLCFGKTDYRRPADVAIVLGARAYADGRPSDALADRVRTACELYRQRLVGKLIFSGGPGDGPVHETAAMKRLALQLGVKPADILVDEAGVNTRATVENTTALLARLHASRVLVVSHFYHLPRIKLAYEAAGWNVYTVPAKESYLLRQIPYNMAREVAAFWVYYLRTVS